MSRTVSLATGNVISVDNDLKDTGETTTISIDDVAVRESPLKEGKKRSLEDCIDSSDEDSHSTIHRDTKGMMSIKEKEEVCVESAILKDGYRRRKRKLVVTAAGLLALNNGFLNGACLSGFVSPGSPFPALTVSGLTASYSLSGLGIAKGNWEAYGIHVGIILSYFTGTFIAGLSTPNAKPYRLHPTYGPTFLVGGVFLLGGGIVAIFEKSGYISFFLSAAASGIQNGIASKYSANLIRCTVTGTTTDIALVVADLFRGNSKNLENGQVLAIITMNFWLGGLVSFFAAKTLHKYTLLANAIMFWAIGLCLIFFLATELGLSVNAAITGNWKWRKAMRSLRASTQHSDVSLLDMFDIIDTDKDGYVTQTELLEAFISAGVTTDLRTVKVLTSYADRNNDGFIDRDEWKLIVTSILDDDSNSLST
jgi:hypothetical protein